MRTIRIYTSLALVVVTLARHATRATYVQFALGAFCECVRELSVPSDKRLFIGSDFGTGEGAVGFLSNRNFHESNLIVWTPSSVIAEMTPRGNPFPKDVIDTLQRRLAHLREWVAQGHTLILVGHGPVPYRYKVNSHQTNHSALEKCPPLDEINLRIAAGTRVEYCGPAPVADLFTNHLQVLRYDVVLGGANLTPLLRVALGSPGATQIVGGYRPYGEGLIVYLPPISGNSAQMAAYINDASKLSDALVSKPSELPVWIDKYQTANDRKAFATIADLTRKASDVQNKLEAQQSLIRNSRELKRLIFDTGASFASAVAAALSELGLQVVEGPHPRADLLASNGVRFAAVEAKGVEGSTKEKDIRQTVQWMAEVDSALATSKEDADPDLSRYVEQLAKLAVNRDGSDCKGLLIMGSFRKTAVAERTQPSFPEPVTRVLERADVCALTGLQLFGLVLQSRDKPSLKPTLLTELFETRGVLQRALDWNEFLTGDGTTT
jgi:hypothetical protein